MNYLSDGVEIPTGRGNFGGSKALAVSAAVFAAKGITQYAAYAPV